MLSTCEHQESKLYLGTMWDVVMRCLTVWLWLVVGVKSVVHHYYYCYTRCSIKVPLTKERKWEVQKRCCFDKNCSKWLFKLITTIEGRAGLGESLIVSVWAEIFHCKENTTFIPQHAWMYLDITVFRTLRSGLLLSFQCCWQLLLIWRWQSPMKACQYSKYNFIIRIFTKT